MKKAGFLIIFFIVACAALSACTQKKGELTDVTVTLDFAYEAKVESITIKSGSTLDEAYKNITRDGYEFLGWYTGGVEWDFDNTITENLSLTASWKKTEDSTPTFSVTFYNGDGTVFREIEVKQGSSAVMEEIPYLDDYHRFVKWNGNLGAITEDISVYPVFEYAAIDSENFAFTEQTDGYIISDFVGEMPEILCLPKEYKGKDVIGIADVDSYQQGVFAFAPNILKVYIPKSYRYIGNYAFYQSSSIYEIYFEDDSRLEEIGVMSFAYISADAVNLPKPAPNTKMRIATGAFMNCYFLNSINISEAVTEIGVNAFFNAGMYYGDVSLTVPDNNELQYIMDSAFANAEIKGDLFFPKLLSVGNYAFSGNIISSVRFSVVEEIGKRAFYPRNVNEVFDAAIKSIYFGNALRRIGAEAFAYSQLSSVVLPKTLAVIDSKAFCGSKIASVTIPEEICTLGEGAFADCLNLTVVNYNTSIDIPNSLFSNCADLGEINFGGSFKSVGAKAFSGCASLNEVELPASVTLIGESAFSECSSLSQITAPSIVEIDKNAFYHSGLASIEFNNIKTIYTAAFYECGSLESVILNGNSLTLIGSNAFCGCNSLSEVVLPSSVETIEANAFSDTALKTVKLPSSLRILGEAVYKSCQFLQEVIIPGDSGRINFGDGIFTDCQNLEKITVERGNAYYSNRNNDGHLYNHDGSELVIFIGSNSDSYVTPNTLKRIGAKAFSGNFYLRNLTIGSSVEEIGESAFSGKNNSTELFLRTIDFSDATSLHTIGDYAFGNCSLVESIDLSACTSLETIGDYAFYNCRSLKMFGLPDSLTEIGESAFEISDSFDARYLFDLDMSDSALQSIGKYAFKKFAGLKSIVLPSTLTLLGEGAFCDCRNLQSVDLSSTALDKIEDATFKNASVITVSFPKEMNSIGVESFSGCAISNLDLSEASALTIIGSYAFFGNCLSKIILPPSLAYLNTFAFASNRAVITQLDMSALENLETIKANAFANAGIESVILPENLQTIEARAFYGNNMKSLIIPDSVTVIGEYAFAEQSQLKEVSLGKTNNSKLNSIGAGAFNNCMSLAQVKVYPTVPPKITEPIFSKSEGGVLVALSSVKIYVDDRYFSDYLIEWSVHRAQIYNNLSNENPLSRSN